MPWRKRLRAALLGKALSPLILFKTFKYTFLDQEIDKQVEDYYEGLKKKSKRAVPWRKRLRAAP